VGQGICSVTAAQQDKVLAAQGCKELSYVYIDEVSGLLSAGSRVCVAGHVCMHTYICCCSHIYMESCRITAPLVAFD